MKTCCQPVTENVSQRRYPANLSFLCLAVLLVTVAPLAASLEPGKACPEPANSKSVSDLLTEGITAFEAGDNEKAELKWMTIRACAPGTQDWPKAVFNLGLLETRRKNFREAIAYFDDVLQSHSNDRESGSGIMETNRNYSHRSAMGISEAYEAMGAYRSALHYAWLAKTKYPYYSWCGTCHDNANFAVKKRIAYLTLRASRLHIWASVLLLGFVGLEWRRRTSKKQL